MVPSEYSNAAAPARPTTVLVVDDDERMRLMLAHWIVALGHETESAPGADEALAIMRTRRVDVVICDMLMPGHDGLWLIGEIRRSYPAAAIIIATGIGDMRPTVTLAPGVVGYLVKPFAGQQLAAIIDHAVAPDAPWRCELHRADPARPLPTL